MPAVLSTDLLTALNHEWKYRLSEIRAIHPLTGAPCTAEQLLQALRTCSGPAADTLWHPMIHGDDHHQRIVLQALLGKAVNFARSCKGLQALPTHLDRVATAIAALWEAIRTFPTRYTTHVVGNLVLRALSLITRQYPARQTHEVAWEEHDSPTDGLLTAGENEEKFAEIFRVLTWARDHAVLTHEEIRLLANYELTTTAERAAQAAALGIKPRSLTHRVCLLRKRLREALQVHGLTRGALAQI